MKPNAFIAYPSQEYGGMKSSLVRGMPYATMTYPNFMSGDSIRPTVYSEQDLESLPLVDEATEAECGASFEVANNIEFTFTSGLTWLVFFSQPVTVQCTSQLEGGHFKLDVLELTTQDPLIVRLALVVPSTDEDYEIFDHESEYKTLLRERSNFYPGEMTNVEFAMSDDKAAVILDWDTQSLTGDESDIDKMIMFGMPHHQDRLDVLESFCTRVLLGSVCLIEGSNWTVHEDLPDISFHAPRDPDASLLPDLIAAVTSDLEYRISDNFFIGAGDTYFSGKELAKLSRIIVIAQEVLDLCTSQRRTWRLRGLISDEYASACSESTLPTSDAIETAVSHLQEAVDVWISGEAQAPFLYDHAWGGVISCGCTYSNGNCLNVYPNCPALSDQGLNFGFSFYNDHHFHLGYHIHSAAVLASFNTTWGEENFEKVLLFVRDIANPSVEDASFPLTRHKDWYHGSSWASGITAPVSPTGMNQESTSEAIAGYEAVALFGKVMSSIFEENGDSDKLSVSEDIYKMGRLLTATELRSTKRYWQVTHLQEDKQIFDPVYEPNVVGILWSSKAWFGTWFGTSPFLIYGIQLLPFTAIAEERDDMDWITEMFDSYAQSCDGGCVADGWSVQILGILATLGQPEMAAEYAKDLTETVFQSPGGNGHSMSNTLWYIATRAKVDEPYTLTNSYEWQEGPFRVTCLQPDLCTDEVLDTMAGDYDCRSRITYLVNGGKSEYDSCYQVAVQEFPESCGMCNPIGGDDSVPIPDDEDNAADGDDETTNTPDGDDAAVVRWTCNQPACTEEVLRAIAGTLPCGDRIEWLMNVEKLTELEACSVVAVEEFPDVCGGCNPN